MNGTVELATFGMGCFWCGEASFSSLEGIKSLRVGYMGGTTENPTYEQVCSGGTGHIEVVEIRFDASKITFQHLLGEFWNSHNPSEREGDGDSGSQYGSVIFFNTEEQKAQAEESKRRVQASGRFRGRITTQILSASKFWVAEERHQCYIAKLYETRNIHGLD